MNRKIKITVDGATNADRQRATADREVSVNESSQHAAELNAEAEQPTASEMQAEPPAEPASDPAATPGAAVPEETAAYITALQADLEEARTRAEDAEKRLIYAQAEFQNVLRRREEQQQATQKYSNSEIIKALLPVLDNFERALKAAERARNFDALIGGVTGTHKQFLAVLEKAGLTPIVAVGKEFDPNYHEAIGHAEESDLPANTVAEEVQRGYIMHDRVLRPTLVKVSGG
jgi:molecular chaperone GrpE